MEVIEEEQGQPASRVGRWAGKGIFDQGTLVFTKVDSVYVYYRRPAYPWTRIRVYKGKQ
jgi:hypothetical protein